MKSTAAKYIFGIFLLGFFSACQQNKENLNDQDPTAFRAPVTKSFEFTAPEPIEWEVVDPDSIDRPKSYPLDLDKLPSQPFGINEFRPLKSPMKEYPLNWDNMPELPLQFDTIPVEFKKSFIPKPLVTKVEMPGTLDGTSSNLPQLSTREGLPSDHIKKLIQNDDGTFWIATLDGGISLYNGEHLYTYTYGVLYDAVKDQNGKLWISSENGIYVLDFRKNIQTHFSTGAKTYDLFCDHNDFIWMANRGSGQNTYVVDSELNQVRHISNSGFKSRGFFEDQDQNIWVGGLDHISIIPADRETYKKLGDAENFRIGFTGSFFEDNQGYVWLSAAFRNDYPLLSISIKENKIHAFDRGNFMRAVANYQEDDKNRLYLVYTDTIYVLNADRTQLKHIETNAHLFSNSYAGTSLKDSSGLIWVGTTDRGVILIDPDGPSPEVLISKQGLLYDYISGVEEDSRGNIWLPAGSGINIFDPKQGSIKAVPFNKLGNLPVNSFYINFIKELEKDKILFDAGNGFMIIDRAKKGFNWHLREQNEVGPLNEALKDEEGNYWLATGSGLAVYHPELNQLKNIPESSPLLACKMVRNIISDESGKYWLGTDNGLVIIDPVKNTIQHLREQEGLCDNDVLKLLLRENGQLCVATTKGISIIDFVKQTITNLGQAEGLIPDEIYDLQEKKGVLYAGSKNGLIQIEKSPDENTPWVFNNYGAGQGLQLNDYMWKGGAVLNNGQMWLPAEGQKRGITIFKHDLVADTTACPVQISNVYVLDNELSFENTDFHSFFEKNDTLWSPDETAFYLKNTVQKDSGYAFEKDIFWDSLSLPYRLPLGLKLPYGQNSLKFSFTNLCVLNRDKISYRYMLKGADKTWIYNKDIAASKTYFNLSAGKYTFKVATKGISGKWSAPTVYSFTILPPWWHTWWAYTFYGLCLLAIIFLTDRYQRKRIVKKEQAKARDRELAQAKEIEKAYTELESAHENLKATQSQLVQSEKLASLGELTAGIAHEIQNPLNFVNNFSELSVDLAEELKEEMEKDPIDKEFVKELMADLTSNQQKINHHGKRAASIVTGMLQHARTSTGAKEPTDLNALADEYLRLSYHGLRAKDSTFNAKMVTDLDPTIGKLEVVPQDIGRVFLNLINNAFYATQQRKKQSPEGYEPTVSVSSKKENGQVVFKIKDNGTGIPTDVKAKIFQPFFTTKPTGKGTGLGLSLAYDIITKGHGGTMEVQTKEGEGTEFIIALPFQ